MKRSLYFILISLLVLTCGRTTRQDVTSEEALRAKAIEAGNEMAMKTQKVLGSTLKSTIQNEGIPQALKYCNVHAYPLVDSLENQYDVIIRRASSFNRNPQNKPDEEEMKIIKTYLADLEAGRTPETYVKMQDDIIHFAKPIILSDQICLNCHGKIGENIKVEHYKVIQALYSDDQATGHALGDLRGIWSIKFKKESLSNQEEI